MEVERLLESLRRELEILDGDGLGNLGRIESVRFRREQLDPESDEYAAMGEEIENLENRAQFLQRRIISMEKMADGNGRQYDLFTQMEGYNDAKNGTMEYTDSVTTVGNVQTRETVNDSALISFAGLDDSGNRLDNGVRIGFEYNTRTMSWEPKVRGGSQLRTGLGSEIRAILDDQTIVAGLTQSEINTLEEILSLVDGKTRDEQKRPESTEKDEQPEGDKTKEPEQENDEQDEKQNSDEPTRTAEEIEAEIKRLRLIIAGNEGSRDALQGILNDPKSSNPGSIFFLNDEDREKMVRRIDELQKEIDELRAKIEELRNEKPLEKKDLEEKEPEGEESGEEKEPEGEKSGEEKEPEEEKTEDDEEAKKLRRAQDVLPILKELEELKVVPALSFEAVYAYEVDKRLAKFREELANLEDVPENARARERLENIISELEALPRVRAKNKEKEQETKGGEGETRGIAGGEGEKDGAGKSGGEKDEKKEPEEFKGPRHWVEIMAETQTQTSGSIPTYFHQMGKIQPFRMGLTIWAAPVKLAMKGVGKLFGDALGRCQAKKDEMLKNIRNLSDEEFEILVNGLTETNMRQYKVNEIYLDAVQEVLAEKEGAKKQAAIERDNGFRQAIEYNDNQIDKLKKDLENPALTPEQQISLQIELQQHILVDSYLRIQHDQAYQAQIAADKRVTDFERGKVGKSTRRMNIQGWLAGSFNPDNRELHQQEAALRKEQREAGARGDTDQVLDTQRKIEELQENNTHVIQLLEGTRFETRARINRGLHTVEEVHQRSNDAEQTKGRELVATAMAAVTFANMVRTYQANQANQTAQQQIDQHNADVRTANDQNARLQQEIEDANAHNADLQRTINSANSQNGRLQQEIRAVNSKNATVQGQVESARGMVSEEELTEAATREIHENNALAYAARHEEQFRLANDPSGSKFNIGKSDTALHEAQSAWSQSRTAAQQSGSLSQEVASSAQRAQQAASDVLQGASQFPSLPGKGAFTNSEYVQNLQYIMSSQTDSFSLLQKLLGSTKQIGDTAQVTGSVAQITDSVAQVTGTVANVAEMAPLVLDTAGGTLSNILPFITAMANLTQLEAKKAQMDQDRKQREEANVSKSKEKEQKEQKSGDER